MSKQHHQYVIIGGGICGMTAAETIRERDASGSVLVIGDEPHALYSRVLLPNVARGKVPENKAFLKSDAAFAEKHISIMRGTRVVGVDAHARELMLDDGRAVTFEKLLIATGGRPRALAVEGADEAPLQYLQTIDDAKALSHAAVRDAIVIGGGFIALELIMSYVHHGARTTAILRKDGFFSDVLDAESSARLNQLLRNNGVEILARSAIARLECHEGRTVAHLDGGGTRIVDAVGVGIGIDRNIRFLAGSAVECRTGVVTDARLMTASDDIYAAGDVAEYFDPVVGAHRTTGNWQNALFQGKVAGENMAGGSRVFDMITTYNIPCFGTPLCFIGATDQAPDRRAVHVYADGSVLQLLCKNGVIVGATCIGRFSQRASILSLISSRKGIESAFFDDFERTGNLSSE